MTDYIFTGETLDGEIVEGDLVTLHAHNRLCIARKGTNQNWSNTDFTDVKPESVRLKSVPLRVAMETLRRHCVTTNCTQCEMVKTCVECEF